MARPGLMKHRKFLRLAAVVGGPAAARGHLEMLWDSAYECGDPAVGDATDVELLAGWVGQPGKLVQALLTCGGDGPGFIEEADGRPGQYQVHDLFHHAPDYVRKRWTREAERRSRRDGMKPLPGQRPVSDQAVTGPWPVTDRSVTGHGADIGRPPAPAPKRQVQERDASAVTTADEHEDLTLTSPGDGQAPRKRRRREKHRPTNPDVSRLIKHYSEEFVRTQGSPPLIDAADAAAVPKILAGRPFDGPRGATWLVTMFLEHPDEWTAERGLLRLRDLPAAVTKILAKAAPSGGNGKRRDATGAPLPVHDRDIEDTIELDDVGVERHVRIYRSTATGEVVDRQWGRALHEKGEGDGTGKRDHAAQAH